MEFVENCIERATALAATCGWLAFGGGVEAAAGVVIGAAGLASLVSGAVRRHGPESEAALRSIRARIAENLASYAAAERWDARSDLQAADLAMERALAGCFLDRQALAASARSPEGFPGAATRLILEKLAEREPNTFGPTGPEPARDYARLVVRTALEAAIENESYFRALNPHLLMETLKGIGTIEERLGTMHEDVQKILSIVSETRKDHSPFTLAQEIDGMHFELTANDQGKALMFHDKPLPYPVEKLEFDPDRRELHFIFPGGFKRDWGLPVHPNIARNLLKNTGQILLVLVDVSTLEPVAGKYVPLMIRPNL